MTSGDEDLRNRFAALRQEDEERTPAFRAPALEIRAGVHRESRARGKLLIAAASFAAAIALVLWLRPVLEPPRQAPAEPAVSITRWTPPTEFLLDTPGGELTRSLPAFGVVAVDETTPEPGHRRRKHAKKVTP
jgi:hypothetical protein